MELNIQAIADAKIQEMHESGQVEQAIKNGVETLILKAIDSALNNYSIRHVIEEQVSKNISSVVADIGLSGYNGFIAETLKKITEGVMRDDVAHKIQKTFHDMLIVKHDGIKLSEIIDAYREHIFESVDEVDKRDRYNFTCGVKEKVDGNFTHIYITLSEKPDKLNYDADITFSFCIYGEKEASEISRVSFSDHKLGDNLSLGSMDKIESLIANLYYNKTPIILDLDDIDDSDHYDIDN